MVEVMRHRQQLAFHALSHQLAWDEVIKQNCFEILHCFWRCYNTSRIMFLLSLTFMFLFVATWVHGLWHRTVWLYSNYTLEKFRSFVRTYTVFVCPSNIFYISANGFHLYFYNFIFSHTFCCPRWAVPSMGPFVYTILLPAVRLSCH